MLYTKETPHYDENKEVIKLTLDVNTKHYPNFPKEMYVSEFYLNTVISKLSGLDYSIKEKLNLSEEEFEKSWIAYGVKVEHTKDDKFFGVNGNTIYYKWI